jgi:hypothetical protein
LLLRLEWLLLKRLLLLGRGLLRWRELLLLLLQVLEMRLLGVGELLVVLRMLLVLLVLLLLLLIWPLLLLVLDGQRGTVLEGGRDFSKLVFGGPPVFAGLDWGIRLECPFLSDGELLKILRLFAEFEVVEICLWVGRCRK